MISVRNLLTGIVLGAIVSVLVRQIAAHGLEVRAWAFAGTQTGEALVTGALVGAISQMFGQTRGRR
ncbi:hypothetical protein LPN01_02270 [Sphingomonas sp. A2-49]|uniref:hypothetical protein n=1 Tax=Sphingomonas sp. A2-49 TaxID=1391375 RepID=UPI0021CECECE|nr:hypothetical protein [Sphingomonas sp. A2-49]MCU6452895.1 hypothetical protein [Sphingomonas sp. A2-49]